MRYAVIATVDGIRHRGWVFDGVPLQFFRPDAEVVGYTPEACMTELFTREQADLLVAWIKNRDPEARVEVQPHGIEDYEALLTRPGVDGVMPVRARAVGGPTEFLDLSEETLRDISFKAWALYDVYEAQSHRPESQEPPQV